MQSPASLAVFFLIAFCASFFVGYAYLRFARRRSLDTNAVLHIRAGSGMYRSRLVAIGRAAWEISAPLQRDSYVPLRVGEDLVIESPAKAGVLIFRSEVVARNLESHSLKIRAPKRLHHLDRRELKRWPHLAGESVKVEGEEGRLIDISQGGARLETEADLSRGERVRVDLPWADSVFAWVLAREGTVARLRFEELMELKAQP
jgi:c-di-GMP-binding flagellar brake protein YcgR